MSQDALLAYAQSMFDIESLKKERIIDMISDYDTFDISNFIKTFGLDDYDYECVKKTNITGFYMKWHLDNACVFKNKRKTDGSDSVSTGSPDAIPISDIHVLQYFIKRPSYTLIIYDSDHNIDFKGGTLEFIDGVIVKPKKGMYVFFNSNELHRVNRILSGSRVNYLVKFYKK